MIFYFSGTGNSKWVAQQLADVQQERLVFIPDALRSATTEFSLQEEEKVGFVFPIYSWGPPPIVLEFIHQLVLYGAEA
ncbi:MAG: EFR1 family ferrodoxin, partial [Bacteroides sp.]